MIMPKYNIKDKIEANEIYSKLKKKIHEKEYKYRDLNFYVFDELLINRTAIKYYEKEFYYEAKMLWKICLDKLNEYSIFDEYYDKLLLETLENDILIDF